MIIIIEIGTLLPDGFCSNEEDEQIEHIKYSVLWIRKTFLCHYLDTSRPPDRQPHLQPHPAYQPKSGKIQTGNHQNQRGDQRGDRRRYHLYPAALWQLEQRI